jgi:hypothetical protein
MSLPTQARANRSRASYEKAVEWIALNDNEGDDEDADALAITMTVLLVADLWNRPPLLVAEDVFQYRHSGGGKANGHVADQVFRDPAAKVGGWRIAYAGHVLPVDWETRAAATAYLNGLRRDG